VTQLAHNQYLARKNTVLNQVAQYQEFACLDQEAQFKILDQKFRQLLSIAVKSSWWQPKIVAAKLDPKASFLTKLQRLPILTRTDLQQFGEWMKIWIPGSNINQYSAVRTSGSTGKPVSMLKYLPGYSAQQLAIQLLDGTWQQRDMSGAFCHLRINADDFESTAPVEPYCYESKTGTQYIRKLSGIHLTETLTFLAEKQISNILINPIALRLLCNQQLHSPIPNIRLQQILSWGDKLETSTRELAFEAFGAKVCDRYSAEELGYLAIQCPHAEHLHALQFYNYIEILDESNQPCPPGVMGKVVVTNWHSFGMPVIRYELGDLAQWGEPCPHGINLPVLQPTIVRIRDISLDEQGRVVLPRIEKTALTRIRAIADFQIVQFTTGIVALIRLFTPLSPTELAEIKADLASVFPNHPRIEVIASPTIDWLAVWKRKLITRFDQPMPTEISILELKELLTKASQGSN
jgi:phenylacetate-CoA ligase